MPACPPFRVREVPGMGRGLLATRKIKAGSIILEELPILVYRATSHQFFPKIKTFLKTNTNPSDMAKILSLHDPLENLKSLDSSKVEELINKDPARWLSRYRI